MKFQEILSPARKHIALIAHDNQKEALTQWCLGHRASLEKHELFATGTTAQRLITETGLSVTAMLSGPLGGDQQIGAKICSAEIDILIFFWDPFEPMPHDPDVKALLRIAAVWNIPVACNQASADFLIRSTLMADEYSRLVPDYGSYISQRT